MEKFQFLHIRIAIFGPWTSLNLCLIVILCLMLMKGIMKFLILFLSKFPVIQCHKNRLENWWKSHGTVNGPLKQMEEMAFYSNLSVSIGLFFECVYDLNVAGLCSIARSIFLNLCLRSICLFDAVIGSLAFTTLCISSQLIFGSDEARLSLLI